MLSRLIEVSVVTVRISFMGYDMERAQDIKPLTPGGRRQQDPGQTPERPEPRAQHAVRGVQENAGGYPPGLPLRPA